MSFLETLNVVQSQTKGEVDAFAKSKATPL